MYLAVELAPRGNRKRLPEGWPWRAHEMRDGERCPEGCIPMSIQELEDAKQAMAAEYERWKTEVHGPYTARKERAQRIHDEMYHTHSELFLKKHHRGLSDVEELEMETRKAALDNAEATLNGITM